MSNGLDAAEIRPETLQIRLLGAPQLTRDGSPVTGLTSAKTQALLFHLVVTGETRTRAALATLLWGDMTEAAARGNLRKALQQLRTHFGDYLRIEHDAVGIAEGADLWVDVADLTSSPSVIHTHADASRVQRAVDLYRGDFLGEFHVRNAPDFEDWWLSQRILLRESMLERLTALAAHRAAEGDLDGAILFIRRLLETEPWREEAHRSLMTWLAMSGQRSAALAQYAICRQALAEELDVEPDEQTTTLYERIRTGGLRPSESSSARVSDVEERRPAFLDGVAEPEDRPPEHFVGRDAELAQLFAYLESALRGLSQVAFVAGEAGWGKTRLLSEFARRAQQQHADLVVATGACTEYAETGDPYLPFREVFRDLYGDIERAWASGEIAHGNALRLWNLVPFTVEALLTQGRHLVDVLVPGEAVLRRATVHDAVEPDQLQRLERLVASGHADSPQTGISQARIFAETADVLHAVSQERPLLLVLDDLHWSDVSSLSLLSHLARRLAKSPILILGAYRPEEISFGREGSTHPLEGILTDFKGLFGDVVVQLQQDELHGRGFVNALLDTEPNAFSDKFRLRLAESTRGYPLFTVEALEDMKDQGQLYRDENDRWVDSPALSWDALPRRVEGVIERRVNRMDPAFRRALEAASVEGEEFTAEAVARVCGVDEAEMVSMLSGELAKRHRLIRASAVRSVGSRRVSSYRFGHNLFQSYLYDTLDPVERAYLHEAMGTALEELHRGQTDEIAVRLARHFVEAGRLAKAVTYLRQAGDAAARVYANAEAISHYSQAIDLSRKIEVDAAELIPLFTHLGRALELESLFDRALAVYEEMEMLARQRKSPRMELASLMARAAIQSAPSAVHDAARAQALGERALALAGELEDPAAESRILWSLSLALYFSNQVTQAIAYGERSLALARGRGLLEQTAQTLNDLGGFIYLYSGRLARAKEALEEAGRLWETLGNRPMFADSLGGACVAHVYAGDYDRAIELSEQCYRVSREIGNLWGQSYSGWTVGDVHRDRGEYSRAIEVSEACIRDGEQAGFLASQTYTRLRLAAVYADLGVLDHAMKLAEVALVLSRAHLPSHVIHGLGITAGLQCRLGSLAGAEQNIGEATHEPYRESWAVLYLPVLISDAELALRRGDHARALSVTDDLLARLREYGMRSMLPEALYLQGRALAGLGHEDAARDRFLEARLEAESIGSRRILWRVLGALSALEVGAGEAGRLRDGAARVIEYIADHIDRPDLRASFLAQPEVRAIVSPSEASAQFGP